MPLPITALCNALGVSLAASPAEVRAGFRRRALEVHPDKGGTAAAFREVMAAYEALIAHVTSREAELKTTASAMTGSQAGSMASAGHKSFDIRNSEAHKRMQPRGRKYKEAVQKPQQVERKSATASAWDAAYTTPSSRTPTVAQKTKAAAVAAASRPTLSAACSLKKPCTAPSKGVHADAAAPDLSTSTPPSSRIQPKSAVSSCNDEVTRLPADAEEAAPITVNPMTIANQHGVQQQSFASKRLRSPKKFGHDVFGILVRGRPLLERLCIQLQRLPLQMRREILSNRFSQSKRLKLEDWMLMQKEKRDKAPDVDFGVAHVSSSSESNGEDASISSNDSSSCSEGGTCDALDAANDGPHIAVCDISNAYDTSASRSVLALCSVENLEGSQEEIHSCVQSISNVRDESDMKSIADGSTTWQQERCKEEQPSKSEDNDDEVHDDTELNSCIPSTRITRGVSRTSPSAQRYFAMIFVHMLKVQSVRTNDLATALEHHMVLVDMKRYILEGDPEEHDVHDDARFECRFMQAMHRALEEHGISFDHLRPTATLEIPSSYWIGKKLHLHKMEIQKALALRSKLAYDRGRVIRGGQQSLLAHMSPPELESVWLRLRATYLEWVRECRYLRFEDEVARLNHLYQQQEPCRQRSEERWNRARMKKEEQHQVAFMQAAATALLWERTRLKREEEHQLLFNRWEARQQRRELKHMARLERQQRFRERVALATAERQAANDAAREHVGMKRADREARHWQRTEASQKQRVYRAESRIQKLLDHWDRSEKRAAQKRRAMFREVARRHRVEERLRKQEAVQLQVQRARARVEDRQRRLQREERWRQMNRRDLTMADILVHH